MMTRVNTDATANPKIKLTASGRQYSAPPAKFRLNGIIPAIVVMVVRIMGRNLFLPAFINES